MIAVKSVLIELNSILFYCRQETLFCVSSSLICDGVNHCPSGEEYNSDEDPNMCARQRGFSDPNVCKKIKLRTEPFFVQKDIVISQCFLLRIETNMDLFYCIQNNLLEMNICVSDSVGC